MNELAPRSRDRGRAVVLFALVVGCAGPRAVGGLPAEEAANVDPAADVVPAAETAPLGVRAYPFAAEDCFTPETSALAAATLAGGPWFVGDTRRAWTGPASCAFVSPQDLAGALFVDVDGDGHDDALARVRFERTEELESGREERREEVLIAIVRAGTEPLVTILDTDDYLEVVDAAHFERGLVVVTGTSCSDCGCDELEVDFECRAGACEYAAQRVTRAVEPCDSP